jgi:hypothetical protein
MLTTVKMGIIAGGWKNNGKKKKVKGTKKSIFEKIVMEPKPRNNMTKTYGHFHQTDDGDWYLIPEREETMFRTCVDRLSSGWSAEELADWIDYFNEHFLKYYLPGGVESYRVLMSG